MNTYTETIASVESAETLPSRFGPTVRKAVWIFAVFALLWLASTTAPFFIRHTGLQAKLTSRISAALGRAVEVRSYDFSLWTGPALVAQTVSVAEDPRFGSEYFVRAESMSLNLRWVALMHRRIEPVQISLKSPTLNVVRNAAGDWNLAEWLPQPIVGGNEGADSPPRSMGPSLTAIDVDGGRINFKRDHDKLPFALVNLSGQANTDSSGRWRLDLTATPWRAAADVQQIGTLHATGYVGGTSSRLWPGALNISWSDASLPDFLRLVRGDDDGIRGNFAASIDASTHNGDGSWTVAAFAQISDVHRWDLPLRADNPALNLRAKADWNPADSTLQLNDVRFEAPHSNGGFSLQVVWSPAAVSSKPVAPGPSLAFDLSAAQIDASDILSWLRAFHGGMAENLSARGTVLADVSEDGSSGAPLAADVSTQGILIAGLAAPVRLGPLHATLDRGLITVLPATISFDAAGESSLQIQASPKRGRATGNQMRLSGSIADARSLLAATRAFGWDAARGWDIAGPVRADLTWDQAVQQPLRLPMGPPSGFIEWGTGTVRSLLRAPFLNLPVAEIKARVDFRPGSRHVTLSSASAFGGRWSGTLDNAAGNRDWQFMLSADRLAAADLDRWINPRWRQSFLDRMLPFLASSTSPGVSPYPGLFGEGHIDVAQFMLGTWNLGRFGGDLSVSGRHVEFDDASAQLSRGTVQGSFAADLAPVPTYTADVNFTHVDLSSLTDTLPALAGLFDGAASGEISIQTSGNSRADVLAALSCSGSTRINSPQLRKVDLMSSLDDVQTHVGSSRFPIGAADFRCANRSVTLRDFTLSSAAGKLQGAGSVNFDRRLDLVLRRTLDSAFASPASFHLSGTLANPQVALATAIVRRAR